MFTRKQTHIPTNVIWHIYREYQVSIYSIYKLNMLISTYDLQTRH